MNTYTTVYLFLKDAIYYCEDMGYERRNNKELAIPYFTAALILREHLRDNWSEKGKTVVL